MKGLLLKDWYLITRYCRAFFLMDAIFIAVSLLVPDSVYFLAYPCLFSAMLPVTLYSYDEREHWTSYSASLPVSRAQFVSAKFLFGLLSIAVFVTVYILIRSVVALLVPRLAVSCLSILITGAGIALILPALTLPLMLRFGAEKGRILYLILVGALVASEIVLMNRSGEGPSMIDMAPPAAPAILCAAALLLYAASWLLSIRLYSRRDL